MELTTPVFEEITLEVGPSRFFRIKVKKDSSASTYIQSARLDGKEYDRCYIDYSEVMRGGTLELVLGDKPNKKWGVR